MTWNPVLRSLVRHQMRQEYAGLTDRVQSMLGFPAPWATIAVAYLLQNTIFLIMALLVLNMRQWDAWPVTAGLVLAFNLYLPRSVARRGIVGLDREALREVLYLSPHPIERLWVARLAAETVSFWIHYGGPELVACLVLVSWPANPLLGVGLAVIFIGVVTAIHLSTLTSRAKPVGSRIQIPFSYWRYLLTLVGLTMLTAVGTDWLIVPIARHPLPFSMLVMDPERTLRAFSNAWREHLLSLRHTCTVWVYGHAGQEEIVGLVGLAAWIVIRLFNAKREARILEAGGTGVGAGLRGIYVFYHAVARAIWPSDPFVRRDLLWLQRNQVFTPLSSPLQLMMPPVVSSALGVVISLFGVTSPAGFVLGCWFIALQSCYQTASLFFWSFPIVYPGSELRQQELIRLSPTESLWRLKRSKARLLGLLGLPLVIELLLIFLVAGFVQRIGAWNLAIGLTGLIAICALAFLVCSLRIFAMNRYDYDDIFAVARENVGLTFIRILEQLPKRLLYIAFLSFLCLTLFFQNAMSNEWISLLALALACVDVGVIAWTWILSGRGTHLGQNAHRSEDPENRRDWRTFRRALLSRWGRLVLALCGIYAFAVAAGAYLEISFVPPIAHNPHLAWQAYFIHNVVSWGMAAGLGLLTLGFGSLVLLAFNGLIAGEAVCLMFQEKHAGWIYTAFLPHAVFEIPAQLLAALVPYLLFASIGTGGRGMESGSQRWVALRWAAALSFGAMALLFLAAWMESIFGI